MNIELLERWSTRLRSGKYSQCQNQLSDGTGFCCLGVLAEMEGIDFLKGPEALDPRDGMDGGPTSNMKVYSQINTLIPDIVKEEGIRMNDSGKSFEEIADMIDNFVAGYNYRKTEQYKEAYNG